MDAPPGLYAPLAQPAQTLSSGYAPLTIPPVQAIDAKATVTATTASAQDIADRIQSSSKAGWWALLLAGIAIALVVVALLLYVVVPSPTVLHYPTSAVIAGPSTNPTTIVPAMNTLYSVTATSSSDSYVKFGTRSSGYTLGVVYYVTNASSANTITVQTTANSFTLEPGKSAMMRVDANGNSHRLNLSAI